MNPWAWLQGEPHCTEEAQQQAGNPSPSLCSRVDTALKGRVCPGLGTRYACGSLAEQTKDLPPNLSNPVPKPIYHPIRDGSFRGLEVDSNPSHYRLPSPSWAQIG